MPYDPRKAAQTIAFFALKEGGSINVLKVVKLVYLADRESLRQRGHPIQYEARFSMPHGPVNSTTLDYLNGFYRDDGGWSDFLRDRANNDVGLANQNMTLEALDELSKREIGVLESVWLEFGHMDRFDLAEWTHDHIPEWEDPNGSSRRIPLDRMMAAVGLERSVERARELESLEQASAFLGSL